MKLYSLILWTAVSSQNVGCLQHGVLRCQSPVAWDEQLVWHDKSQNTKDEKDSGQANADMHGRVALNPESLTLNPNLEYKSTDSPSTFCKNNSESKPFAKFETIYTQDQPSVNFIFWPHARIYPGWTLTTSIEIINLLYKTCFDHQFMTAFNNLYISFYNDAVSLKEVEIPRAWLERMKARDMFLRSSYFHSPFSTVMSKLLSSPFL